VQTQTCKWGSPKWNVVLEEDIIGQKWKVSIWAVTYLNWFAKWSTTAFTIITTILLVFLVHTIHSHTEWSEVKWSERGMNNNSFTLPLQFAGASLWWLVRDHVFWLQPRTCAITRAPILNPTHTLYYHK
jgi:hypothetical protein